MKKCHKTKQKPCIRIRTQASQCERVCVCVYAEQRYQMVVRFTAYLCSL